MTVDEITDEDLEIIAKGVKKLRLEAKFSQDALGNIIDYDQSTISAIEKQNRKKFSIDAVKKISNYFGSNLGVEWLISKPEVYFPSFDKLLDLKIREIVRDELDKLEKKRKPLPTQDLGTIDEFDIKQSINKYNDPYLVLEDWFHHEGRDMPKDFAGFIPKKAWNELSSEEKIKSIKERKELLDKAD